MHEGYLLSAHRASTVWTNPGNLPFWVSRTSLSSGWMVLTPICGSPHPSVGWETSVRHLPQPHLGAGLALPFVSLSLHICKMGTRPCSQE